MTSTALESLQTHITIHFSFGRRHERGGMVNRNFIKCFAKKNEQSWKTQLWKALAKAGKM